MPVEHLSTEATEWLAATAQTELLRFTTAGSVDDGKSTLIGRLLYDSKGVYEDQLASVRKATRNLSTNGLDLSLLTDGLRAEREQGITIDVAYRYFSTPRRKFIIADTPGPRAVHAQHGDRRFHRQPRHHPDRRALWRAAPIPPPRLHRRAAGNSAPRGRHQQDGPGGIPRGRLQRHPRRIPRLRRAASQRQPGDITYIPISALEGDNVVNRSSRTPWYDGPALLEHLETVPIARDIQPDRPALSGAVRDPSQSGFPRLRRPDRFRRHPPRRRDHRPALRPHQPREIHRHLGRRSAKRPSPRCRSPSAWKTKSISAAATCSRSPATCRTRHAASTPPSCG